MVQFEIWGFLCSIWNWNDAMGGREEQWLGLLDQFEGEENELLRYFFYIYISSKRHRFEPWFYKKCPKTMSF